MLAASIVNGCEWIPLRKATAMLGVDYASVRRLARAGHLGTHKLPGGQTRYLLADVERLAEAAIQPAKVEAVD